MPTVAVADHLAGGDIESGKQRRRAVANVVVAAPLRLAGAHRKQRLGAIERLDLALLVDAQHHGMLGRAQVEPDDVAHLLDEQRVVGELEGLGAMRLQAEGPPDALHARGGDAALRAIDRELQWVASCGVVSSVATITASTLASSILRGTPGRGSS